MRFTNHLLLGMLILFQIGQTRPADTVTDFAFSTESLQTTPFDEIHAAETVTLDRFTNEDRPGMLSKLQQFPKLTKLNFFSCDLSQLSEKDPVPLQVTFVMLANCKISEGTIQWLAKFPHGNELIVGGSDVRGMELSLGKFSWLKFDNCTMSRTAIAKIVEKAEQVIFKEITVVEDK